MVPGIQRTGQIVKQVIQGPTLADARGPQRIRKLEDRARHIDEQIAELQDKKSIIEHEIQQLGGGMP
jgi:hypothetical protein